MYGYKELLVWQKSMKVATKIYGLTKKIPQEEKFGIISQINRAAVSIPSNIAEGSERSSKKEFSQFLAIARGSKAELETQLRICVNVGYLSENEILDVEKSLKEIGAMLSSLISKNKDNIK